MTKFKDIIFEENVAIHCPEEWMDESIREALGDIGYRWNKSSVNVKVHSNWSKYENDSCINLENNDIMRFDKFEYYKEEGFNILHYDDVAIKDETSLDYELIIKGRKAEIGSELWYKTDDKDEKIVITGIFVFVGRTKERIYYSSKNRSGGIDMDMIDDVLFWEKPTIYQLPDTDGNLSEVKVGQEVYLTEIAINKTKKHKISKLYDGCIYFNDTLFVWNCTGYGYVNFGGVNRLYYKTTTNKPHRDFSDCPHWEDVPKAKYWAVDRDGASYWYYYKPEINEEGTRHGIITCLDYEEAGYRADLLNENGVVEDWEYSLVKKPEGV